MYTVAYTPRDEPSLEAAECEHFCILPNAIHFAQRPSFPIAIAHFIFVLTKALLTTHNAETNAFLKQQLNDHACSWYSIDPIPLYLVGN